MSTSAVVRLRCIPIANQQTVLIGEVLHPIGKAVQEAKVVGSSQGGIISAILPEFSNVSVEVELGFFPGCHTETTFGVKGPASVRLSSIGRRTCNRNFIHLETLLHNRPICPVAEAK